jgi:hypothetical protein
MKPTTLRPIFSKSYVLAVCVIVLLANAAFSLLTSANTSKKAPIQLPDNSAVLSASEMIQTSDGSLFGTVVSAQKGSETAGFGVIYRVTPQGQVIPLHVFDGEDGAHPSGKLLHAADGYIYGVTTEGGKEHAGTIYKIMPDGSAFEVIHSFSSEDGRAPIGGLVEGPGGYLYGTASQGGSGNGTVFSLSGNGQLVVLHSFSGEDGAAPYTSLMLGQDGLLYGTTREGGAGSKGNVFRMAASGAAFEVVHNFSGPDGTHPDCELIQTANGSIFGATANGGTGHDGVLFTMSPDGSQFAVLHSFTGYNLADPVESDAAHPISTFDIGDGYLYGTTMRGGQRDAGAVYKANPQTGQIEILFSYKKGAEDPLSGLVLRGGTLYLPVRIGKTVTLKPLTTAAETDGTFTPQATDTVTTNADSGAGSLRAVIAAAAPGDTITFSSALNGQTITLTSGEILINESLTITGPGASSLTISGNNSSRIFFINSGTVSISGLTIASGLAQGARGGNSNDSGGGGGGAGMGGGVFVNSGSLSITGVTFNSNQANGGIAGGLVFDGTGGGGGGGGTAGSGADGGSANGGTGGGGGNLGGIGGAGGTAGTLTTETGANGTADGAGGGGAWGGTNPFGGAGANGGNGSFGGGGGGGGYQGSGGAGGNGGFGGGGGGGGFPYQTTGGVGGVGGMFGGNGDANTGSSSQSGSGGGGAGLGGALFVRSGNLVINSAVFSNNSSAGSTTPGGVFFFIDNPGLGKGGAIFINTGVTGSIASITYSGNSANNAGTTPIDNNNIYGAFACAAATPSITAPPFVCPNSTGNTASGTAGESSYSWTITGGTITSGASSQTVTFTAGASGTVVLTLNITDSNGCIASNTANVSVNGGTTVGPTTLAGGAVGVAYSTQFTPSGSTFTFTGTLPTGINLSSSGLLSGTPTQTGSFPITVTATPSGGCAGSVSVTLTITCPTITVSPSTLSNGTAGTAYSQQFSQTGGIGTVTFSKTGTLPTGLTLSSGGLLSGTPTRTGMSTFTVKATDSNGCTGSVSVSLTIGCPTITVTPTTVPAGTAGTAYTSTTFSQSGGVGTTTFSRSGTLPTGMNFSNTSHILSGTPTQTGSFLITITATDSIGCTGSSSVTIVINCPTITVGPTTIPSGTVGTAYTSTTFTQTGGVGTTTIAESGTLPTGMTFNGTTHALSGTPTQSGSFPITITATDSNSCTGSKSYTLTINCPTITVGPTSIPSGISGVAYTSTTFTQAGGATPITFTETGTLPAGLTLSGTGVLSGTPTKTGSFPITVTATDTHGCTGSKGYTVTIACGTVTVGPASISSGTAGVAYTTTFTQTGGMGTITFSETGVLPTGLILSSAGVLSGTPTQTGSFPITVTASDSNSCTGSKAYTLVINCPTITVGSTGVPSGTAGVPYAGATFTQTGGVGIVTFTETGALPSGLTFSSGALSGTPTQTGSFPITVTATDSNGCTGSAGFIIVINCPVITFNSTTIAAGTAGVNYSASFLQSSGVGPINYTESGTLPTGLTFSGGLRSQVVRPRKVTPSSSTGSTIQGTPTQTGSFPITITATDANGCVGSQAYTLVINCPTITISPSGTGQDVFAGSPLTPVTFTQTGGVGTVTFTETGALPTGVTLIGGVLSGTPVQTGSYPITVTATDSNGCTGTASFGLLVQCGLVSVQPQFIPNAIAGSPFPTVTFTQAGAVGAVTFTETGALPAGLTFVNGVLSGTPTQTGSFPITVTATDSIGCFGTSAPTVGINCPQITIAPASLPVATTGVAITPVTFTATGGIGTVTFTYNGTLPNGLTLVNGMLSGTPTQTGPFSIELTATDSNGCSVFEDIGVPVGCPGVVESVSPGTVPSGTVNTPYPTVTFTSTVSPARYVPVGVLPLGMIFSSDDPLTISGTPTQTGVFPFTVMVEDENGCVGETNYILAIGCGSTTITVGPDSVPAATAGTAYPNTTFSATGGTGALSLTFAGAMPAGMTWVNGVLSGTPTQSGTFQFTVAALDATGCAGSTQYTLTTACPTITVSPGSLPPGTTGSPYPSETFTQTGGAGTVTFSESGALPTGLTFTAATATLSGTPSQTGSFPITVTATDANGCTGSASYTVSIACPVITVSPTTAPSGTAGVSYAPVSFMETGGVGTITFTESGVLPAGLSLSSGGVLSGTPTQTGSFPITVTASDSDGCTGSQSVTITINCATITVNPTSVSAGTAGVAYSTVTFTQTGGVGTVTFTESGTLPTGITFSAGVLSGTPTETGSFPITVTATDSNGCTGTRNATLVINCPTITVSPTSLNQGTAGVAYSTTTITQTGGVGTITFTESGALPTGITFSAGTLSGTPTQTGTFTITVTATDSNGCTGSKGYTLVINCPTITVSPATVPAGTAGVAYSTTTFSQTGGVGTIAFTKSGTLPTGLTFSAGVLSGTPTQTGSFPLTITATDSNGCTGSMTYTLSIACPTITVGPARISSGTAGVTYPTTMFTQTGGVGTIAFTESGALPTGLSFSNGVLSGTPLVTGSYPITITATDANGCVGSQGYTLMIACPTITVAPSTMMAGTAGALYPTVTFTQTGGVGTITFTESGTLPTGLSFSSGLLSGTPIQTGTFPFSVTATDANGCAGSQSYTLNIGCPAIAVGPDSIPSGVSDVAYQSTSFTETGGIGTVVFTETGTLPSGMSFSAGVLSGTPTQTGAFPITITATDSNGCTGSRAYVIAVACPSVNIIVTPGVLTSATSGQAYPSTTFSAGGGTAAYTFTEAGALPSGMTFASGVLSGTPTESGMFPIGVAAVDSTGCAGVTNYLLAVGCQDETITVVPGTLPAGTAGVTYSSTNFTGSGKSKSYVVDMAGALPKGMTFANGVLSGTPIQTGTFQFTVAALDATRCAGSTNYTLAINCPVIAVSPGTIPTGTAAAAYSTTTFTQTGGVGAVTFTKSGALPTGLTFTSAGVLSGMPMKSGGFPITVTATDANGCTGSKNYTLEIDCPVITVSPASIPQGTGGVAYTTNSFTQTGAVGGAAFSETGTLPTGLSFTGAGVLSGTPTKTGSFPITVTATDSNGCTGSKNYTLVIGCPTITVGPTTIPPSVQAEAYRVQFSETGGVGAMTFSTNSAMPAGVTLSSGGLLSGTPTQGGTFAITVTATDANGCTGSKTVSLAVTALNKCLKDDHDGDFVQFNTTTGDYVFTHCGTNGFTLFGKATVTTKSGETVLTDIESDRNVTITYLSNQLTGNAVIILKMGSGLNQTYTISDTNPHPVCACGG